MCTVMPFCHVACIKSNTIVLRSTTSSLTHLSFSDPSLLLWPLSSSLTYLFFWPISSSDPSLLTHLFFWPISSDPSLLLTHLFFWPISPLGLTRCCLLQHWSCSPVPTGEWASTAWFSGSWEDSSTSWLQSISTCVVTAWTSILSWERATSLYVHHVCRYEVTWVNYTGSLHTLNMACDCRMPTYTRLQSYHLSVKAVCVLRDWACHCMNPVVSWKSTHPQKSTHPLLLAQFPV